jgi:hypothetical protein
VLFNRLLSGVVFTLYIKVSTSLLLAQLTRLRVLTLEAECVTEVIHESDVDIHSRDDVVGTGRAFHRYLSCTIEHADRVRLVSTSVYILRDSAPIRMTAFVHQSELLRESLAKQEVIG